MYQKSSAPLPCRWLSQAKQEFTQGTQEHLTVRGIDCDDLIQEGLQALVQDMEAWVEQLRQAKVCVPCCHPCPS